MDILQTSMYTIKTFNRLKSAKLRPYIDLYVHSIYERTINLMLDGQLVALQIADSPVSPISIILPLDETGLDNLKIKYKSPVSIDGTNLLVGKNIISLDHAYDVYDDRQSKKLDKKELHQVEIQEYFIIEVSFY